MNGTLWHRRVLVASLALALVLGAAGLWTAARTGLALAVAEPPITALAPAPGKPAALDQLSFNSGFAPVVKRVIPAVVNIASSRIVHPSEEEFSPFFGFPRDRTEQSLGSAVIVSSTGRLLTNHHMIEGASVIKVYLPDGREFRAAITGTDPHTDLAVLKVDALGLPFLTFGDSGKVEVGEFAIAVGNPFGVGQTVTMGIVSAIGRSNLGFEDYENFIQTDAAVNPGSSGGALLNVRGELIGINTAILSEGTGNLGVGFAIPSNIARQVMKEILKNGRVIRGWLGVALQPLTPDLAEMFSMAHAAGGALVTDVAPNGPAQRAGLVRGDIVLEFNGQPIDSSRALTLEIYAAAPHTVANLKIVRKGKPQNLSATLEEPPAETAVEDEELGVRPRGFPLGISVEALTPYVARQLGLPRGALGVVVSDVQPLSPADEAGLQPDDVILEVNRKPVATVNEFTRAVTEAGGQRVLLLVHREGEHLFIAVKSTMEARVRQPQ